MSALSDLILSHIDITQLVGRYVSLKKSGSNYAGLCPFHSEKSPSFLVSPTKQIYKCFGCGKGGNAISFYMDIERLDYGDAIRGLADTYRIELKDFESKRKDHQEFASDKEKLKRLSTITQKFFVESLTPSSPDKGRSGGVWDPYSYLTDQRELSPSLITEYGLGYAPTSSQTYISWCNKQWFSVEDLAQAWLVKQWQDGYYAFFRDRLTIPIRDHIGNIIAFGARALHADQQPKYLNSSDSIIYDKSQTLYGIDHLKQWVKDHHAIIVVEGYFDVIALSKAGYDIAVATCGTSLTASHIKILQRYSDRIHFLFDADPAGKEATRRWLAIAYAQWVYPTIISFWVLPDKGLNSNEERGGAEGGGFKDIDELVRSDPQATETIKTLMDTALDGFTWALQDVQSNFDTTSPIERQKAMNRLFDLIYELNSLSTQALFLTQMAKHRGMDMTLMSNQYKQYSKKEKKVFWPRATDKAQEQAIQKQDMLDQKSHLLDALIDNDRWLSLGMDASRFNTLKDILSLIGYQPTSDHEAIATSQLRREREIAPDETITDATLSENRKVSMMKKAQAVLHTHIHTLIKQATKWTSITPEEKKKLLDLMKKVG